VTGGAGFIGSNLVDRLLEECQEVVVIDNFFSGKRENLQKHKNNPKLKICKADICNSEIEKYLAGAEMIFHLAAIPSVQYSLKNPEETDKVNIGGTLRLLESAREAGVKRFVFSSSCAVYGDKERLPLVETMKPEPKSPYAIQKNTSEHYCNLYHNAYGLETICLRYFNVFGPHQDPNSEYSSLIPKFIKLIKSSTPPTINGDGKQTRDFVYVKDIVEANILAARTRNKEVFGEVFNIGTGKQISVNYVTEQLLAYLKKEIKPVHGPAVAEMKAAQADIEKAKKNLYWEPKTTFEKGLEKTIEYFL